MVRSKLVQTLSTIHGVKCIRARPLKRTSNDVAPEFMGARPVSTATTGGLSGRGEIIAICDTGLDTGDPDSIHPDFSGRLLAIKSYPITPDFASDVFNAGADDGPADRDSGHGTHVAGSAVGKWQGKRRRSPARRPVRGHRPSSAQLVFQAVEQEMRVAATTAALDGSANGMLLAGIPNDLGRAVRSMRTRKGARVHSNSWGGGDPGDVRRASATPTRSASSGRTRSSAWSWRPAMMAPTGTVTAGSTSGAVTAPGTAKNCVTVGACESLRPEFDRETYGSVVARAITRWRPTGTIRWRMIPIRSLLSAAVAPPTDGRIEARRHRAGHVHPLDHVRTKSLPTTAPLAGACSGDAGQIFLHGWHQHGDAARGRRRRPSCASICATQSRQQPTPSAALAEGHAHRGGGAGCPERQRRGRSLDNHQGFGRVDLAAVLNAGTLFVEVAPGLATGQIYGGSARVASGASRLRVALCYSDYPGPSLVNNLNLILTAPDGRKWTASTGATGGLALDNRNNVEVVTVAAPASGRWRFDVVGSNVPQGPQDFAVVILGAASLD